MINIIKSADRYHADFGWLQTNWHFSFSDYYDPKNMGFSALRVFNDDVIQPGRGFDLHPHRDMEIVTYVIDGALEHKDHLGNRGVVHAGEVQVMSAGRGIMHAEYNASKEHPVRLLQLWLLPRTKNLPPRWEQKQFTAAERSDRFLPVISGGTEGTLHIDQDTTLFVSHLPAGHRAVHRSSPNRHAYLFVISGQVTLNGQTLNNGDQARLTNEPELDVQATEDSELILLDLP